MNVLVTGAAGFVGHHLVAALRKHGYPTRAMVKPGEDAGRLQEMGAEICLGDVRQPETLERALEGMECVFHLAAIHGLWRPREEYLQVNVAGTDAMCQAAVKARVKRFVYISSWTVYGMALGKVADESFPLKPIKDIYTETKAQAEMIVRGYIEQQNLPAVIVRPGTIFGPGDQVNFGRMADRLRSGKAMIIGSGKNVLPFVYVEDAVEGMILAALSEKAVGQVYNLSTQAPITQQMMWEAIAAEIGARPPRLRVPYYPLYLLATIAELAYQASGSKGQPLLTRLGVMLFGADNQQSIDKASAELGYSPRMSIRNGVRRAAQWYLESQKKETAQMNQADSPVNE